MRDDHIPRPDPYPDELDDRFCLYDETLCTKHRPCWCCWAEGDD